MDRRLFRIITLCVLLLGAVAPDIEHATYFLGTSWAYGLHTVLARCIFGGVLVASGCGLISRLLLRRRHERLH